MLDVLIAPISCPILKPRSVNLPGSTLIRISSSTLPTTSTVDTSGISSIFWAKSSAYKDNSLSSSIPPKLTEIIGSLEMLISTTSDCSAASGSPLILSTSSRKRRIAPSKSSSAENSTTTEDTPKLEDEVKLSSPSKFISRSSIGLVTSSSTSRAEAPG